MFLFQNSKKKYENKTNQIKIFLKKVQNLKNNDCSLESLELLHNEIMFFLQQKLNYFIKSRINLSEISKVSRWGTLFFSTLGIIYPLIEPSLPITIDNLGYILLVIAGSFLLMNNIFGGVDGHTRYTLTFIKLEKLLIQSTVKWTQMIHQFKNTNDKNMLIKIKNDMFLFLIDLIEKIYNINHNDAEEWSKSLKETMNDLKKNISK